MSATVSAGRAGGLPVAVLVASLLEVIAPGVTLGVLGVTPGAGGADLLITPAGWAFAIWGPIYLLAIAQAVGVLVASRGGYAGAGGAVVPRRLLVDLLVLYLGGTAWILVSAAEISWATAVVLVVMAVAGVDGALTAVRPRLEPTWLRRLTLASVGLYAGWVTAAVFLNLATAGVEAGWVDADSAGWQLGVLVVAGLTVLAVTVALRGVVTYALAGVWAFVGIIVTTSGDDQTALLVTALVGALAVGVAAVAAKMRPAPPSLRSSAG